MNIFTIGWLIIFGVGLAWEIWAVVRKEKGDTLSEHVWWLIRVHPIIWFCSLGLCLWALFHFYLRTWVIP